MPAQLSKRKDKPMILEEIEENKISLIDKQNELIKETNIMANALIDKIDNIRDYLTNGYSISIEQIDNLDNIATMLLNTNAKMEKVNNKLSETLKDKI